MKNSVKTLRSPLPTEFQKVQDIPCSVAEFNAALCFVTRANKLKIIISLEGIEPTVSRQSSPLQSDDVLMPQDDLYTFQY